MRYTSLYTLIDETLNSPRTREGEDLVFHTKTQDKELNLHVSFDKKNNNYRIYNATFGIKQEALDKRLVYDAFDKYGGIENIRVSSEDQLFRASQSMGIQTNTFFQKDKRFSERYLADFAIDVPHNLTKRTENQIKTRQVFNKTTYKHVHRFLEKIFYKNLRPHDFTASDTNSSVTYQVLPNLEIQSLDIRMDSYFPPKPAAWAAETAGSGLALASGFPLLAGAIGGILALDIAKSTYIHRNGISEKRIDDLEAFIAKRTNLQLGNLKWDKSFL